MKHLICFLIALCGLAPAKEKPNIVLTTGSHQANESSWSMQINDTTRGAMIPRRAR